MHNHNNRPAIIDGRRTVNPFDLVPFKNVSPRLRLKALSGKKRLVVKEQTALYVLVERTTFRSYECWAKN